MATEVEHAIEAPTEQSWKDVLADILPRQGEWSEEEYLVLTDSSRRLIEYTDGFVEVIPMPTYEHQAILKFLFLAFFNYFETQGGLVMFAALRLRIRPGKFREPDLLLFLSASDPRGQDRFWTGADLALEVVSKDKPERDLKEKRGDYAEGGVLEYWIVNPLNETITVLRLKDAAYEEAGVYKRGQAAVSVLRPGFSISVDGVFDSAARKV
jgi:Uma2 family endonuclease